MPTTSNFGWTTPADTDLVKDGASAIRTLGNGIDTSLVDLKGGTTGQVLSKASNTDMDFSWTAVVSQPTLIGQISGGYIRTAVATGTDGVLTLTEDVTYYAPIFLNGYQLDRIGFATSASHTGSSTVRLGLYNASTATGKPTTVAFDAGTVVASAASTSYEITISQTPTAGFYFLAINAQTITGTPSVVAYTSARTPLLMYNFSALSGNIPSLTMWQQTGVTGAFATAGTITANTNLISIGLRMV